MRFDRTLSGAAAERGGEVKPSCQTSGGSSHGDAEGSGYLPRCVFTCFDAAVIAYLHDTYNVKTQGFMADEMYNFDPGEQGTYSKMWAIAFPMRLLTAERVKAFQEKGLLPWCYCPDTEEQVAYALDCGVTLLTCNNPLLAIRRLQEIR